MLNRITSNQIIATDHRDVYVASEAIVTPASPSSRRQPQISAISSAIFRKFLVDILRGKRG